MTSSKLSLTIWPTSPNFPLPSIDVACLAVIAYFRLLSSSSDDVVDWTLQSDWNTSISSNGQFPVLDCLCQGKIAGFTDIVDHVQSCDRIQGQTNLDKWMTDEQKADCIA